MTDLSALARMSAPRMAGYLVVIGALSGVAAWCLILVGALVLDFSAPTLFALLFAIPRGSLFALIVGFGLRLWWRARSDVEKIVPKVPIPVRRSMRRMNEQVEAIRAIARMRDATEPGYRREAIDWALGVLGEPGEPMPEGSWALGNYQPVPDDPLATIEARLERECHRAITADELGSWGYEELGDEWSGALAQVVAGLTGRDASQILQHANAEVRRKIGPPPPGYG